jgi:hypothetical protein
VQAGVSLETTKSRQATGQEQQHLWIQPSTIIWFPGTITSSTFSSLEWELTEETNFGVTARLFNNKLSLDADYYIRDTKNAAIFVNIPAVGGTVLRNVGIIRNSGFRTSDELEQCHFK